MTPNDYTLDRVKTTLECFELRHGYTPNREEQIEILRAEGFDPDTLAFFREAASITPRHPEEAA
ncbi:hypothetical protein EHR03_12970 [Leptospira mayottensis]|uniref:Uncharacterized protein n=1 Tax=Leptospira mayottensis 200901116 TaxID=1192864 RepID=M6VMA6_9LEPT|nr:hypothetical protein [Leptospira mayottensis]AVH81601.1 hypothetical protein [Leptospira mayottensis 200901116]TGN00336.1 hypothetical protein EHR03_12970 [Leptospira mayottensis]